MSTAAFLLMLGVGFTEFHPDPTLNFMMNRMSADIGSDELNSFAQGIEGLDNFINKSLQTADESRTAERFREAGCYFRAAEFFMAPDDPRKKGAYDDFRKMFARSRPLVRQLRKAVAYEGGSLAVIDMPANGPEKDVILACSGFDGLIEEMYDFMLPLAENGYRVVLFEGPGQGAALRRSHLPMTHEWEQPVAAVLDELNIPSCTLLGLSLGGYLAPRAAAFEPRVQRVVAWGAMYDFFESFRPDLGDFAFAMLSKLLKEENHDAVDQMVGAEMERDVTARWGVTHGIHTCGGKTPYDFLKWSTQLHLRDVSEDITQDVLLMTGTKDHLVPLEQLWKQAAALTAARSVTVRVFTEQENAAEHCQVANPSIVVNEIYRWLEALRARDTGSPQLVSERN